jgi:hydrogenase nickel incorporation protein HypA/HybF
MHELGITQEIIAIVVDRAGGARVTRVMLEIGKHAMIVPDAIRFCFDLCGAGTAAEGAALEILEIAGRARCRACGAEIELEEPFGICACGGTDLQWLSGDEIRIKEMEVA